MLQLHVAGVFPRTVSELVLLEFASFCKILLLAIKVAIIIHLELLGSS